MTSPLLTFPCRHGSAGAGGGPAAGLESLAAQARNVRRAHDLPDYITKLLIDLEHHAETAAAKLEADEILADAEVA